MAVSDSSHGIDNRFWLNETGQLGIQRFRYGRKALYPGRLQDEYVFVFCLKGRLAVSECGVRREVPAGHLIVGNSHQWRQSEYASTGECEGLSLIAAPRLVKRLCNSAGASENAEVLPLFQGVQDGRSLERVAESVLEEMGSAESGSQEMLDALGREFLIRALRLWRRQLDQSPARAVRLLPRRHYVAAIDYMQTRGKSEFAVETMCSSIGTNSGDFNRLFRNSTGMSPLTVYNRLLILRAREALAAGDSSIKEISYRLGFRTPSHFTSLFRKITGSSPTESRGGR